MIELQNLSKQYDRFLAVDNLNLTIGDGEFFGLLGPNGAGKSTTMKLTVHKKLAGEFKAIFNDMYKIKFRIKASQTAAYVWKTIIGTGTVSQHSYGLAIDINWNDNPCFYNINTDVSNGYGGYQPGKNQYSVTKEVISIWKAHGFYWGGDWQGKKDTMHFSYTER